MFGGVHNNKSYLLKASTNYELGYHEDISVSSDNSFEKSTTITLDALTAGSYTPISLPLTSSTDITSIVSLVRYMSKLCSTYFLFDLF